MANVIRIKRRLAGGASGAPATLKNAELAFNEQDNKLYYGKGADGNGDATSIITIGGVGWDSAPDLSGYATLAGTNTFTGSNTFSSTSTINIAGAWQVDGVAVLTSAAELNVLDSVTAGTASASKALVVDASKNINLGTGGLTSATVTTSGNGTVGGNLTVTGDLIVNGTTTTVNSTVVTIDDPIFTVGGDADAATDDNKDRGVAFKWHNGTAAKTGFFGYDDSASVFTFVPDATITSEVVAGAAGDLAVGKVNNVTFTTPASAATLTLGSGKTVTISNTLTFTGTDTSSVAFGTGGTVTYTGNTLAVFSSTTSAQLAGVISDETGSGSLVFATSPTLVTPTLGVASATSVNKVAITAPATSATLTIADGKTLTASNTLTFTGTDSSSVAFGTGGTVVYTSNKLSVHAATTSAELAGVISDETGSGALVFGTSPSLTTPALAGETFSTTNNVTAGTNAQGQGALTSDYNVVTTTSANPSGVTLPTATAGRRILIVNKGTNPINIYPASGATVDALAANASIQLPVNGVLEFNASSTTQWYSSFNSSVTGTGVTTFSAGTTGLTPSSATTGAITLGGTLAVANGGTGVTTSTGTGSVVLSNSPTLVTPALGTPSSGTLTNCTGYTVGNLSGLGANVGTFLATPSSANLAAAITDETGSGALVFAASPTLVTPTLGVASATSINKVTITAPATGSTLTIADGKTLTASNTLTFTGTDSSSVAFGAGGTVAYTGNKLSVFAATTSAELAGVISDETGSGALVFGTSPAFTTSVTTGSTTFGLFDTTATTINAFGAATTLNLGYDSTAASTTNICTGATASATTATINIGTGGAAGSTTNINLGSSAGGTVTVNKDLTVTGNLTINGTTTTVNSTTMTVDDPIITLGGDAAPASDDNKDRGVEFRWHNGTTAKVGFFGYDDSTGKLTFIPDATNTSEVFSGTLGTIDVGAVHISGAQIAASNLSNGTTGSGSIVLATSPTLVTPVLGTPSSGTLTSCTGLPISTGVSGLGTNVATFLGTPSSANLAAAVTDETGSGALVFATSPTLVTPVLGTPSSGTLTSCTGLPISTGVSGLGTGVATFLGTPSSANLAAAVTDETGSGALVFGTSPAITTPTITFSTSAAVTAGTNAQGQGALTSDVNVITTAASNPSGVTLPTATIGRRVFVVNRGANAVNVYPASGATIDGLGANAAISLPVNGVLQFNASSTTQWYSSANESTAVGAITGLGTNVATFLATPSSANLASVVTDETGSGALVFATSPTLVTPTLGVASATSINKVAITAPATSATLTIADGKTLTASNTLTFTGTDSSSVAFGSGGTVVYESTVCTAIGNCTLDGGTF